MKKMNGIIILGNHALNYKDNCVFYFNERYFIIETDDVTYKIKKENIVDVSFYEKKKTQVEIIYKDKALFENKIIIETNK